ncbi:response regulator [Clostridium manihotivorum]|uniref:Stage 0 sporulation protein A homolog n=1 Tax=Clostridium manihotivorum TaxID=2320868 RepID=A0A3R5U6X2_9CLOT|nr:response regulator [Clostridium manihotivorum]QAA30265.1 DNA-binding response regulator [Clostridium manihotivorum]
MWKLLVADDEPKIRRGIVGLFDWSSLNIQVIGQAEDGEVALKIIEEERPDIILLDICMPFLSGLDLVEKIRSRLSTSIIIIISGYDEFAYAQKALKLKVFDYILKPIDSDMLGNVIDKAIKELNKIKEERSYLDWSNKQIEDNSEALKQSFLSNWVNGRLNYEQLLDELNFFDIKFNNNLGIMVLTVVERLSLVVSGNNWQKKTLNFAITNIVSEVLSNWTTVLAFVDDEDNIVIIMDTENNLEWFGLCSLIEEKIYNYLHYTVIVEQKRVNNILSITESYKAIIEGIARKVKYKPVVLLAIRYINKNYFVNDLNLEKVAEEFEVNPSYLSKLLKQQTGMSFIDYVTNIRINKAMCIMEDPSVKIYEVAELVGYSNQHYFCKAFKKVTGFSPSEYRGGVISS